MFEITGFDRHYMTSDMRRKKVKRPSWFKCPIESPETITLIHTHENGLTYLGIWERMQAWAVRNHETNGAFILKSGPMTVHDIVIHCGLPRDAPVAEAIDAIMCLGWIAQVQDPECYDDVVDAREQVATKSRLHDTTEQDTTEQDITSGGPIAWSADDGWVNVTFECRERWTEAYPAVDIEQQLARMDVWLRANPAKAKRKLWERFITNWLSRGQDRGGDIASNPISKHAQRPTQSKGWTDAAASN